MKVSNAQAYLCDIPVEQVRTDALQAFTKQETIFVDVEADGIVGTGYSYTIGTGGRAVLELLKTDLLPQLVGQDCLHLEALWERLFLSTHATTVGPITNLALCAIDTALWDARGKATGMPLWLMAGGAQERVPLYDTEGGWLHLTTDQLVESAIQSRRLGWHGVKIKVGKAHLREDLERIAAVRQAIGDDMALMVDANQAFTYPEAKRRARAFEEFDVYWFEEPLPADDIEGHARLAASTAIPIAVGESIYSLSGFREYLARGAAGIVQPDVARIGGISAWLKVAHLAEAFNIEVAPHFLMEIHVGLAASVKNGLFVEHIPQLRALTRAQVDIRHGFAYPSMAPGVGIEWDRDAIAAIRTG